MDVEASIGLLISNFFQKYLLRNTWKKRGRVILDWHLLNFESIDDK